MKLFRLTKVEAVVLCSTIDAARHLAKREHLVLDPADDTTLQDLRARLAKKFNIDVRFPRLGEPLAPN